MAVGTPRQAHAQGAEHAASEALGDAFLGLIPLLLLPSSLGPEMRFARVLTAPNPPDAVVNG